MNIRQHVSYHESGHAVVQLTLGGQVGLIRVDGDTGLCYFDSTPRSPDVPDGELAKRLRAVARGFKHPDPVWVLNRITAVAAGGISTEILLGSGRVGDETDREIMRTLAGTVFERWNEQDELIEKAEGRAYKIVRENAIGIKRVAEALLASSTGELTGVEIADLLWQRKRSCRHLTVHNATGRKIGEILVDDYDGSAEAFICQPEGTKKSLGFFLNERIAEKAIPSR